MGYLGKGSILTLFLVLAVAAAAERKLNGEERLLQDAMASYFSLARPAPHPSNVTSVSIALELIRIADYDIINNVVKINAWLSCSWKDYRLTWDPAEYDGVDQLHLFKRSVWIPDLKLFNGARPDMEIGDSKVLVQHQGQVMWIPPVTMEFPCALDHAGTKFNCRAKMGSWTYNGFQVDLVNERFGSSNLIQNPLYNVSELSVSRNVVYYPCCPEPYMDITFTFDLGFLDPAEYRPSGGKSES